VICMCAWGALTSLTLPDWEASPVTYRVAAAFAFPFACASGVLAYLGLALRLLRSHDRVLDQLSHHAYGIYLVHYVFVLWLQYAMVGAILSAPAKMMIVFSTAMLLSWTASAGAGAVVGAGMRKTAKVPAALQPAAIPQEGAAVAMMQDEGG
jgi:glucan biosynthesis protein C